MINSLSFKRKLKILVNLGFSFLFIILILVSSLFAPDSTQKSDYYTKITPQDIKSSEIVFDLGINITNIGDLDLSSKTFNAEGSIWLKWNELPDWVADEWDLEISEMPIKSLYFTNIADGEGFQSEIDPSTPYLDADGKFIQWLSFSGKFYAKDINLRRFPFEQIDLPIELESDDFNISDAVFIHNQEGNIVGSRRNIHGFKYKGVEVKLEKNKNLEELCNRSFDTIIAVLEGGVRCPKTKKIVLSPGEVIKTGTIVKLAQMFETDEYIKTLSVRRID